MFVIHLTSIVATEDTTVTQVVLRKSQTKREAERRSPRAQRYALDLAMELRGAGLASAYHLQTYYSITDLKAAVSAIRQGGTVVLADR